MLKSGIVPEDLGQLAPMVTWVCDSTPIYMVPITVDLVNFVVTLFSLYSRIENISENYILENFCTHK